MVFAGFVPEEEKADHYRLADAFVMPGRGEGFGIVYLEALACGLPIVASSLDASSEVVLNRSFGRVVNPDRPQELKAACVDLLARERSRARGAARAVDVLAVELQGAVELAAGGDERGRSGVVADVDARAGVGRMGVDAAWRTEWSRRRRVRVRW